MRKRRSVYKMMKKAIAFGLLVGLLASCDQSKPQQGPQPRQDVRSFADEDECEDAGMSDAYCDMLFPELEDFFGEKKKKKKPTTTVKPIATVKVTKPTTIAAKPIVKPKTVPSVKPKPVVKANTKK